MPGWAFDDLLPYFKKSEDHDRGASEWHGAGGVDDGGSGHLKARQATVEVTRGTAPAVHRRLWLPDANLGVREVVSRPLCGTSTTQFLRSVS